MWKAALIAWILAVPLWFVTRFLVVIAHEGGHALVGTALLNQVRRISFTRDGGGTEFVSPPPWPFTIAVGVAGYAGPSLFGLLASALLLHGEPEMVLWASMAFLPRTVSSIRTTWATAPTPPGSSAQPSSRARSGASSCCWRPRPPWSEAARCSCACPPDRVRG